MAPSSMRCPSGAVKAMLPCPPEDCGIRSASWSMTSCAGVPLIRISFEIFGGLRARMPATTVISAIQPAMTYQGRWNANRPMRCRKVAMQLRVGSHYESELSLVVNATRIQRT
jgi:hypothetical protein